MVLSCFGCIQVWWWVWLLVCCGCVVCFVGFVVTLVWPVSVADLVTLVGVALVSLWMVVDLVGEFGW